MDRLAARTETLTLINRRPIISGHLLPKRQRHRATVGSLLALALAFAECGSRAAPDPARSETEHESRPWAIAGVAYTGAPVQGNVGLCDAATSGPAELRPAVCFRAAVGRSRGWRRNRSDDQRAAKAKDGAQRPVVSLSADQQSLRGRAHKVLGVEL